MSRFPLSIDLHGKLVFLVGQGEQIRQKEEKLRPFGPVLIRSTSFAEAQADLCPAMVIVGDTPVEEAGAIYALCCRRNIPVNVVDVPRLCSFYFPALITRGDLTVSVSTGGSSPAAAGYLRQRIEQILPEDTAGILEWICVNRDRLKGRGVLKAAVAAAFSANRPLTEGEVDALGQGQPENAE